MFVVSNVSILAGGVVLILCVYKFLIHPLFISPLSRIPSAHPLAALTPLWMLWIRYTGYEIRTIHKAHQKLGPIIRIGPNEISVNCVKGGIQTVYSGGFEKGFWYDLFVNYGYVNTHSVLATARCLYFTEEPSTCSQIPTANLTPQENG
jgi:hypothetical protein